MATPRGSSAYPAPLMAALTRAMAGEEILIPCPDADGIKPNTLRLQFYGLMGALKREGKGEYSETLLLTVQAEPPALRLAWRDSGRIGALVARALEAAPSEGEIPPPTESDDAAAAFARIMQGEKP